MLIFIVLASGNSKRMGQNKLLMDFNKKPLIENCFDIIKHFDNEKVVISQYKEIEEISKKYRYKYYHNDNSDLGQAESIKIALKNIDKNANYLFLLADQPFISKNIINKLIDCHEKDKNKIIIPNYKTKRGNPKLFPNKFRDMLLVLNGDIGGREIIKKYPEQVFDLEVNDESVLIDIDTMEDYNKFI